MRILSVYDLSASESLRALRHLRRQALSLKQPHLGYDSVALEEEDILRRVYEMIGGRTSYLSRVARAPNMLGQFGNHKSESEYCRGGGEYDRRGEALAFVKVGTHP